MNTLRRLLVFEARPCWQPELQRRLLEEGVEVGACRSIRDLGERLVRDAVDGVILDLAGDVIGALRWLARRDDDAVQPPVLVVAASNLSCLEWRVRELGATAFVEDQISAARVAAVCRKLWASAAVRATRADGVITRCRDL